MEFRRYGRTDGRESRSVGRSVGWKEGSKRAKERRRQKEEGRKNTEAGGIESGELEAHGLGESLQSLLTVIQLLVNNTFELEH